MKRRTLTILLLQLLFIQLTAQEKRLYIPEKTWMIPRENDFTDSTSEYNDHQMAQSENIAAIWSGRFGADPQHYEDSLYRFDIEDALQECERFYEVYLNKLHFLEKGKSVSDTFKIVMIIFGKEDGTAYGGGEQQVGMLWTSPLRMRYRPYGALAHELGHSFQYLVHEDGHWGFTSAPKGSFGHSIFEMTSQYMLWQVYPDWMTFENYHLKAFMGKTHLAFLHENNMYHSPYILEYWAEKHGPEFIGRLWREAREGEDAVMTYKRLMSMNQSDFNNEMFTAARKFVTWDMERIREVARPYANQHYTSLLPDENGWYRISPDRAPQNYGYNAIRLDVPEKSSKVKVKFKSLSLDPEYRFTYQDKAGWRYGFLAMTANDERHYSQIYNRPKGKASFKFPRNTTNLWLVVSGAPASHWQHLLDGMELNDEQWPYKIKVSGATINSDMIQKNEQSPVK